MFNKQRTNKENCENSGILEEDKDPRAGEPQH